MSSGGALLAASVASPEPSTAWVLFAAAAAAAMGAASAWLDRSLDNFNSWLQWCGRSAVIWRSSLVGAHVVSAILISMILGFATKWPVVDSPLDALAATAAWAAVSESLMRARWAPTGTAHSTEVRSLIEAAVRRASTARDDEFTRRFRELIGDGSAAVARIRIEEALRAVPADADEGATLTTIGALTEHVRALDAPNVDAKTLALAKVALRRAIVAHALPPTSFAMTTSVVRAGSSFDAAANSDEPTAEPTEARLQTREVAREKA